MKNYVVYNLTSMSAISRFLFVNCVDTSPEKQTQSAQRKDLLSKKTKKDLAAKMLLVSSSPAFYDGKSIKELEVGAILTIFAGKRRMESKSNQSSMSLKSENGTTHNSSQVA